jgi:hypothetical protein
MRSLSPQQRVIVEEIVEALRPLAGLVAIVLGGSHARGRARDGSDVDLGLFYSEASPFSIDALREIIGGFPDGGAPIVSGFGDWGRWVNGGAWLTVRGERIDLLYRSVEAVERVARDAEQGRYEIDWLQHPPFGFFGPSYLGEVRIALLLAELSPVPSFAKLKALVSIYPAELRRRVVQDQLWSVEFGLSAFAKKFSARGDVFNTAASLARFGHQLSLAIFALNSCYPVNDKTVLEEIAELPAAPSEFGPRLTKILGQVGTTREALERSVTTFSELFEEMVAIAGDLYSSRY